MLILSLIAVAVSTVDLIHPFGWYILPQLPPGSSRSDEVLYGTAKAMFLLLGIQASAVSADRMLYFTRIENSLEGVEEKIREFVNLEKASATVLSSRKDFYDTFLSEALNLSHGSAVFVTHYEKLKMSYSEGEGLAEQALGRVWPEIIAEGRVDVEQLVHVSSETDLEEAIDRASSRATKSNYSLSLIIGPPPDPFFEYVIFGSRVVLLGFSARPASPYSVDFGIRIESEEFVDRMKDHFRLWSSQFGVPIKTRDAFLPAVGEHLRRILPSGHSLDLPEDLRKTGVRIARQPAVFHALMRIVSASEAVANLGFQIYEDKFESKLSDLVPELEEYARGHLPLDIGGIGELGKVISIAAKEVMAVCPASALSFWSTAIGAVVRNACANAVARGVIVQRVYIVPDPEAISSEAKDAMDHDTRESIQVFVARDADLAVAQIRDYVIIDGRLVFEDYSKGVGGAAAIDVSPTGIRSFEALWSQTLQFSKKYS